MNYFIFRLFAIKPSRPCSHLPTCGEHPINVVHSHQMKPCRCFPRALAFLDKATASIGLRSLSLYALSQSLRLHDVSLSAPKELSLIPQVSSTHQLAAPSASLSAHAGHGSGGGDPLLVRPVSVATVDLFVTAHQPDSDCLLLCKVYLGTGRRQRVVCCGHRATCEQRSQGQGPKARRSGRYSQLEPVDHTFPRQQLDEFEPVPRTVA